jgi:hypothetical protein
LDESDFKRKSKISVGDTVKTTVVEKGNAKKILEWFRNHKDEEFASILEDVVAESRKELSLR